MALKDNTAVQVGSLGNGDGNDRVESQMYFVNAPNSLRGLVYCKVVIELHSFPE